MRALRRIALAALALALVVATTGAALVVALSRGWQRERLRAALEDRLASALHGEVAIEALEGPLLPDVALRGLRIGPVEAPALAAEHVAVSLDLEASWRERALVVTAVALRGVQVALVRDESGRVRLAGLPAPPDDGEGTGGPPLPVRVQRASLEDVRAELTWQHEAASASTLDLRADAELAGLALADGELRLDTGTATLAQADLALADEDVPPLSLAREATLLWREERLNLEDVELRSGAQSLRIEGALTQEGIDALRVDLHDIELAALTGRFGAPALGGRLRGNVSLEGPYRRPAGRAEVVWRDPRIDDWRGERITASASWDAARLDLRAAAVRQGRAQLELALELPLAHGPGRPWWERLRAGDLALPAALHLSLKADGVPLGELDPWLPDRVRALEGALAADLSLDGGSPPRASGWLSLADVRFEVEGMPTVRGVTARIELAPHAEGISVQALQVELPGARVRGEGVLTRAGPAPLELELRADDLAALAARFDVEAPLAGSLEGELSATGPWRRPALAGAFAFTPETATVGVPQRIELDLTTEGAFLVGALRALEQGRIAARGNARVPYPDWDALSRDALTGEGAELELFAEDYDLAALAPLLPRRVRGLAGRADARIAIRGRSGPPALEGRIEVTGGGIDVPLLRKRFEPIEADVRLREDLVAEVDVRIGPDDARADVRGTVTLAPSLRPQAGDLELLFERFALARSPLLGTDVSGRARLEGPLDAPQITGKLALSDVRVRLPESDDPALREIEVIASDAERRAGSELREGLARAGPLERARIDLALEIPRNSWVRGRGAEIDFEGELRLEKRHAEKPRLSGEIAALRGTYRFQGKRFDVRRGVVTFEGATPPDPQLDIEAEHEVRDVTIVAHIEGRMSAPTVRLSSDPTLPEDDVIALLFFGRRADELTAAQEGGTDLQSAAAALAAGVALREAAQMLDGVLPFDTIDFAIEEGGEAGELRLGRYLTDDLFVRYERSFGPNPTDGVALQYRLSDHWRLETEVSNDESAGIDLIWQLDY